MNREVNNIEEDQVEYLSSVFDQNDYDINLKEDESTDVQMNAKFFILVFINFLILGMYMFLIVILAMFIFLIQSIIKVIQNHSRSSNLEKIPVLIWFIILCSAIIDTQIAFLFYIVSDKIFIYLFQDAISFFQSLLFVISYVNISNVQRSPKQFPVTNESCSSTADNLTGYRVLNTLVYQENPLFPGKSIDFDVYHKNSNNLLDSYKRTMKNISVQPGVCVYAEFQLEKITSKLEYQKGHQLVSDFFEKIEINYYQFSLLVVIFSIKLLMSFSYIFIHQQKNNTFNVSDTIQIFITIGIYVYSLWNLHRVLGNYDLRRKKRSMDNLNEKINFSKTMTEGYKMKLDITCPMSLESWDNSRKFICEVEESFLKHLEFAYICFFFNYIFVTLFVVSAFGEFYWIIPKDSAYLKPLAVILNTMNFIFLNTFLSFRLWEGQKYNDTFQDIENSIDALIDVTEDLITMYDQFFNSKKAQCLDKQKHKESVKKIQLDFNRMSVYCLVAKKIKQTSQHYIKNQEVFSGQIYNSTEKTQLRKQILNNMLLSLQKVKRSIRNDSQTKSYKFLNVASVSFTETISTVSIAVVTLLPSVLPKIIELYFQ